MLCPLASPRSNIRPIFDEYFGNPLFGIPYG